MQFDPEKPVNKLCAQGIIPEGEAKPAAAAELFLKAWEKAASPIEKVISARYVARLQNSIFYKLRLDEIAQQCAQEADDLEIYHFFPCLYLNISKCHEVLSDLLKAAKNYQLALRYAESLLDDGYSNMIRPGINSGIARVQQA